MTFCSCSDRNVEPFSALTCLAYFKTKNRATAYDVSHNTTPKAIILPVSTATPTLSSADTAAIVQNGLIVEPRTPTPAPKATVIAPTSVSMPAATIVEAIMI